MTTEEVLDRLAALGEITSRPMFGGHRSLLAGRDLRHRVPGPAVPEGGRPVPSPTYLARGMGPFRPNERQTLKSYYEVPPDVLADPEALLSWAREAIRAGQVSQRPG